jgi:hypothetical protein
MVEVDRDLLSNHSKDAEVSNSRVLNEDFTTKTQRTQSAMRATLNPDNSDEKEESVGQAVAVRASLGYLFTKKLEIEREGK